MAVRTVRPQARPLSRYQDPMGRGTTAGLPGVSGLGSALGVSSAQNLLGFFNDPTGLAIDFATDQSAVVQDTTTPANNYKSSGTVSNGALAGPGGLLAYSANSPSPKMCLQSNGFFGYGDVNYAVDTENLTTANWTQTNVTSTAGQAGPSGSNNATLIIPTSANSQHRVFQNTGGPGNGTAFNTYWSIFAKASGYSRVAIRETFGTGAYAAFLLSGAGSVITTANANGMTISNATIVSVGNGWYKCSMNASPGTSFFNQQVAFHIMDNNYNAGSGDPSSYNYVGDTVSGAYATQAQLSPLGTNNYIKIVGTTPQFSLPYEWNTASPAVCQGILVEEQRTNLLTFSNTFTNAAWTATGLTNVTTTTTGPDGVSGSAVQLNETTANSTHSVAATLAKAASALPYVLSVFSKVGTGRTRIALRFQDSGGNGGYVSFDVSTAQMSSITGTGTPFTSMSSSVTALTNGWYRCTFIATSSTDTSLTTTIYSDNGSGTGGSNFSFVGVVSDGCYIYQAQLEQASYVTSALGGSPIITGSASVTRAGDQPTLAGTKFPASASQGTVYVRQNIPSTSYLGAGNTFVQLASSTAGFGGFMMYTDSSTRITWRVREDGGTDDFNQETSTGVNAGATNKQALLYQTANYAALLNGTVSFTGASALGTITPTTLAIGWGANLPINGYIQQMAYWPRRFSNTQGQAITT